MLQATLSSLSACDANASGGFTYVASGYGGFTLPVSGYGGFQPNNRPPPLILLKQTPIRK